MNRLNIGQVVPAEAVLELVDVLKDGIVLYRIAAGYAEEKTLADTLNGMADVRELCLFRLQPYIKEWNTLAEVTVNLKVQLYSRYFGHIRDIPGDSDLVVIKQLEGETLAAMESALAVCRNPMIRQTLEELIPIMEESFNGLFSDDIKAA